MTRKFSLPLSLLAIPVGGQALAAPYADTFFVADYSSELGVDACEFTGSPDPADLCEYNASIERMECKAERLASGGIGAIMYMIKNESDTAATDICDGYDYCSFGAIKTTGTTEHKVRVRP